MINKILIANRGEIAVRIIKTCKKLNIETVAIFSEEDKNSLFVKNADYSFCLNSIELKSNINSDDNSIKNTYLNIDKILEIAKKYNVNAIHPGYGFLSENAEFASRVVESGIKFIGPSPGTILSMGLKSTAKKIMQESGVAVLPGYHDNDNAESKLVAEAKKIGYPLLVKAAAGGGGKGMRIVEQESGLVPAIEASKREALKSFANDKLILEKYIKQPRHIEVQVLADNHGNAVYLYERDCSIQRRYQKIIEEAPAPNISDELRSNLGKEALKAANAINYTNAGTIEFLLDQDNNFYFMEMNTRLQVEHPVTEMITGIDLVEQQIAIANNEVLKYNQQDVKILGAAIEARVYAEDVNNNFLPATGKIEYLDFNTNLENINSSYLRVDSGVHVNDSVTIYYDPMLAKIIAKGKDRTEAISNLEQMLNTSSIIGVKNNIEFLLACIQQKDFKQADLSTDFINKNIKKIKHNLNYKTPDLAWLVAGIYYNFYSKSSTGNIGRSNDIYTNDTANTTDIIDPWAKYKNFRLNSANKYTIKINNYLNSESSNQPNTKKDNAKRSHDITIECLSDNLSNLKIILDNKEYLVNSFECNKIKDSSNARIFNFVINDSGFKLIDIEDRLYISSKNSDYDYNSDINTDTNYNVNLNKNNFNQIYIFDNQEDIVIHSESKNKGALNAPMHGTIVSINVNKGSAVTQGDTLVILEAMKMEHVITAPRTGTVTNINYKQGEQVAEGAQLLVMD